MKIIHEFTYNWKSMHRLVFECTDGERFEGGWSLYDSPAFLYDEQIEGRDQTHEPKAGYIGFTEYFEGNVPRVIRYGIPLDHLEYSIVSVPWENAHAADAPEDEDEGEANDDTFALEVPPAQKPEYALSPIGRMRRSGTPTEAGGPVVHFHSTAYVQVLSGEPEVWPQDGADHAREQLKQIENELGAPVGNEVLPPFSWGDALAPLGAADGTKDKN